MGAWVGAGNNFIGSPLGGRVINIMIPAPNNIPTMIKAASHHHDLFIRIVYFQFYRDFLNGTSWDRFKLNPSLCRAAFTFKILT